MTSEEMSNIVRGHWKIENKFYLVLDIHFREDACDKKKNMSYKEMSMIYNRYLEYIKELIFGISNNIMYLWICKKYRKKGWLWQEDRQKKIVEISSIM